MARKFTALECGVVAWKESRKAIGLTPKFCAVGKVAEKTVKRILSARGEEKKYFVLLQFRGGILSGRILPRKTMSRI